MKIAILAGGPESLLPDLRQTGFDGFSWVGADHGTCVLLKNGLQPVRAFGDFDSLDDGEKKMVFESEIELVVFPSEKDKTDLELALDWALAQDPEECLILGGTGGRLDHTLVNIHLLLKAVNRKTRLSVIDRKNSVTVLAPGTYHLKRNPDYPYLSFLSMTDKVSGLTLEGVKYPLDQADIPLGSGLCISNEVEEDSWTVSFSDGLLLMMRSSD
ncbi:thiamine diphosphokinase [Sporolactobacillus sp. THM7-4]|nr:thiamine diphosphokinase [Sporolactobacillus sp. THM7-4]